jgi:hypothetical protein
MEAEAVAQLIITGMSAVPQMMAIWSQIQGSVSATTQAQVTAAIASARASALADVATLESDLTAAGA